MSGSAASRGGAEGPAGGRAAPGRPARFGGWARFIVWMLVLSVPAWFLADAYHVALRKVTSLALGIRLPPHPPEEVEVSAVQVLAAYAAMCLASRHSPWARRLAAAAAGIVLLFSLEALTGIAMIRSELIAGRGGLPDWLLRFRDQALFAPPWLGAPIVWLLLLGRDELPKLPATRERGAPRGGQGRRGDRPSAP